MTSYVIRERSADETRELWKALVDLGADPLRLTPQSLRIVHHTPARFCDHCGIDATARVTTRGEKRVCLDCAHKLTAQQEAHQR